MQAAAQCGWMDQAAAVGTSGCLPAGSCSPVICEELVVACHILSGEGQRLELSDVSSQRTAALPLGTRQ